MKSADDILRQWQRCEQAIAGHRKQWDAARTFCSPQFVTNSHLGYGNDAYTTPKATPVLHDTGAVTRAEDLAAALLHWVCDPKEQWSTLIPDFNKDEELNKRWCDEKTSALFEINADSNFYQVAPDVLLQFIVDGTLCTSVDWDDEADKPALTRHANGTFGFFRSPAGMVKEWLGVLSMSAADAVAKYGEEKLPKELLEDNKSVDREKRMHIFIQYVYRRNPSEINAKKAALGDPANLPFGSVHVHKATKKVVKKSGFRFFPIQCVNFRDQYVTEGEASMFGTSPGMLAVPSARALNDIARDEVKSIRVMANPRVMKLSTHDGPIDLRPGGITAVANMQDRPQEWGTAISLQGVQFAVERRERELDRVFYVALARQFSAITKQMTVPEVMARKQESLTVFTPPVAKLIQSWTQPYFQALFVMAYERGLLGSPPETMKADGMVVPPKVKATSKVAAALEELAENGFLSTVATIAELAAIDPSVMDVIDLHEGVRDLARSRRVKTKVIRSRDQVEEREQARAEAQQAQLEAEAEAKLASNPNSIKAAQEAGL